MATRSVERTTPRERLDRWAAPALRWSIAVVFLWFGALKVTGASPVAELVEAAVPWVDPGFLVPALGWFEVVLGLVLLLGWLPRLTLVVAAVHLVGTFLVFVQAPTLVIFHGNPLLLTTNGEFVLKNVVLVCAVLVLLGRTTTRTS
ncbi:DoxX family membrane protein [Saccharothrix syringae]|uniref:DoxX family membrane protein n=1 Tax=Saccharothrix syringae TaxID=103733 RepID=UPI00069149BD|nr:DoxX family membrane protein [Saccharothrix syringae]